jgi:hypothetical protein
VVRSREATQLEGYGVKIEELVRVLDQIREFYASAGAIGPANDLAKLVDSLKTRRGIDVDMFVAEMRQRLSAPPQKRSKATKKNAAPAPVNTAAIARYLQALKSVGTNQVAFDVLFNSLKADTELGLAEFTEIAHRYSGGVVKYKSIAAARSEISKAFIRQARFANKLL